jgi:hypothetical protein
MLEKRKRGYGRQDGGYPEKEAWSVVGSLVYNSSRVQV